MKLTNLFILLFGSQLALGQFPVGGTGVGARPGGGQTQQIPGTYTDQVRGSGKITGFVVDSAVTKAVEFANVGLFSKKTGQPVDGTTADDKGKFTLNRIAAGDYKLVITFIGFKNYVADNLKVEEKGTVIDLGVIKLAQNVSELQEVTVTGIKSVIEDKVDRLVYNAEKDETSKGGDATDVLKKVPMLSVDMDGNVSLKGNSNVKVLINNKPSSIMASSVADAMKQIPADMIKSVEVITSPSAKYDAEGSSGIINIITKKNNLQGLTLNIDASAGVRGSNLGLNGNYRKGKMGFSLGGFGRANYNVNGAFDNTQITKSLTGGDSYKTVQSANTRNNGAFGMYRLGWDYDISKTSSLTAGLRMGLRNQNSFQDGLIMQNFVNNNLINTSNRNVVVDDFSNNFDLNLDYTKTFKKPQQEFSILTQLSRNDRDNDFVNNIFEGNTQTKASSLKNTNSSFNQEITLQTDYQTPLGPKHIFEIGGKGILRQVSSNFKYFLAQGNSSYAELANNQLGNVFDYDQNVIGSYGSLTTKLSKKYSTKIGLRYEYTEINAKFKDGSDLGIPSYGIVVPSATISKNIKGGSTVKLSYNRRIQRPSLQFLNPNINAANPLNISYGNPVLDPEYTNNYELQLNTFFKNTFLNSSLYVRNTNNAIESLRDVFGNDTIRTTYANIGKQNAYGLTIFGNYNYKNKLQFGAGGDVMYLDLDNNVSNPIYRASNSGMVISGRVFGAYNMKNGWGLQLFSFYRGNQVQLQGSQGGFGIYSLSIKKDLKDKKGSIGLGAENFFTPAFKIRSEVNSPIISQNSVNTMKTMNFKINFNYRIGKMSFDAPRRKKSINNDDQKDGGGGDAPTGGGQPQGGGAAPAGRGR
jgi:outer membrane receptor protein involved in Fe transport